MPSTGAPSPAAAGAKQGLVLLKERPGGPWERLSHAVLDCQVASSGGGKGEERRGEERRGTGNPDRSTQHVLSMWSGPRQALALTFCPLLTRAFFPADMPEVNYSFSLSWTHIKVRQERIYAVVVGMECSFGALCCQCVCVFVYTVCGFSESSAMAVEVTGQVVAAFCLHL